MSAATVVILLGAPGAGKGTQARRLAAACGLPHVSTGDLFRENLKAATELGRRAKEFMESGRLVPDELVLDMLFDRVAADDCRDGYILDGFPRTLAQAEALEDRLGRNANVIAPNLVVADQSIIGRASGRLVCKSCGNIQHLVSAPPKVAGVCDACRGALVQREDDTPAVVAERLKVYHRETEPLVEFYDLRGVLVPVDGERDPAAVFEDLAGLLSAKEEC